MTSNPSIPEPNCIPGFKEIKRVYESILNDRTHLVSGVAYQHVLYLQITSMHRVANGKFECVAVDRKTRAVQTLQYEAAKANAWKNELISPIERREIYRPRPLKESFDFNELFVKLLSSLEISVVQESGATHKGTLTTVHRNHAGYITFVLKREGRSLTGHKHGYHRLLLYDLKTKTWFAARAR